MAIIADGYKEIGIKNVFSAVLESFGTVEILINNAGHSSENKSIADVSNGQNLN
jgi:hypothetical protein